jgi:hypothetical protein
MKKLQNQKQQKQQDDLTSAGNKRRHRNHSTEIISRIPNITCPKCGKVGTLQNIRYVENGVVRDQIYGRFYHGHDRSIDPNPITCWIGPHSSSIQGAISRFTKKDEEMQKITANRTLETVEGCKVFIDEIVKVSKILDEPQYKSIRSQILHRLFLKLPVNRKHAKKKQVGIYNHTIIPNIVAVVKDLDDKKYAYSGRAIKPEFVKVLQRWGVWKEEEEEKGEQV